MLVLSRKTGERLLIDDRITVVVNRISGNRVTLGIEAPDDVHILRGELQAVVHEFRLPDSESGSAVPEAGGGGQSALVRQVAV